MRRRGLALAVLLVGCPKDEPPALDPATQRTIARLQEEQARLAQRPPPVVAPDPLVTAVQKPLRAEKLGVRDGVEAELGPVALRLTEVSQSQVAGSERLSLTTADRFVKVVLEARSREPVVLDLTSAQLINGDLSFPVARDVQRAAKGSPLAFPLSPADEEDITLYFECPPEVVGKGLKIILTQGSSRVELALQ